MNERFIRHYRSILIIYLFLSARGIAQEFQILEFGKVIKYFPLAEVNTYEWQGYMWNKVQSFSQLFDYDDKKNLQTVTFQNWDRSVPRNDKKYTFRYDDKNNLAEMDYFEFINSSWEVRGKTMFSYNENNDCSSILEYRYREEDSTLVKYHIIQNYYNSDNNLVQSTSKIWKNLKYVNFSKQLYYLDTDGNLILSELQKWEKNNWVNLFRIVYVDDRKENLSYRTKQSWIDSTWVDKIKIVENYTEDGLLHEEIKSIWNELNWLDESKWINNYDSNNRIFEQYYFYKGTEVWSRRKKLEYLYHEK